MNPYKTFNKIGLIRGLDAILIKSDDDGAQYPVVVKPENSAFETLNSDYSGVLNIRVWSCDIADLVDGQGVETRPESGDVLRVALDDGVVKDFPITRNATTSRFWDWAYNRPGYRVRFYTKFDGAVYVATVDDSGNGGDS